jgi:hypothetical protein
MSAYPLDGLSPMYFATHANQFFYHMGTYTCGEHREGTELAIRAAGRVN